MLRVLEAAVEAQENTALSEKNEYGKMKNMLILRPLNLDFYRSELVNVLYIRIGDVALVLYWPGAFDSLGIYLFLLVAAPVLLQADSYTAVDNMREFWGRTLRFLRDFCIIILVSGALRELLRHNTLLGLPVAMSIRTEAAEQPFFGLILSGFLLAVLRAVEATLRRAIHRRRQAETVGKEAEA